MPGPFCLQSDTDERWMMVARPAFPLLETFSDGTGVDVGLQNNASAAATAERLMAAAHGVDHANYLLLGYGLGADLILDGELNNGYNGNAGETDMIFTRPPEHHVSLASLFRALDPDPRDPDLYSRLERAATEGGPALAEWMRRAAEELRWCVQVQESIFYPQTIILCGGAAVFSQAG